MKMEFATSKSKSKRRRPSSSEYPSCCGHDGVYQYAFSDLGALGTERGLPPRRADRIRRRRTPAIVLPNALLMLSLGTAAVFASPAPSFVAPSITSRNGRHRSGGSIPKGASLFVSVQHPVTSNFSQHNVKSKNHPARHYNDDDDDNDGDDADDNYYRPLMLQPAALVHKLNSFSSNISRLRAARKKRGPSASSVKKRGVDANDDALIGACTSLLHFLRDEAVKLSSSPPSAAATLVNEATVESTRETLEMVLVQSVRASSELGDFAILIKLAHAAAEYAKTVSAAAAGNAGLLSPRVFGEAVSSLSRTKASLSKVKSLWSYFVHEVPRTSLSSPPSAYELNAMLASLRERGKASAALKVYRQATVETATEGGDEAGAIEGDAYTASILFGTLSDSVSSDNASVLGGSGRHGRHTSTEKGKSSGPLSPCWQWNEATALLGTFAPDRLNNHAYAMLLKVNEKAMEAYGTVDSDGMGRHDGVRCAMSVLERMKNDKISPDVVTCSMLMTTFDKGRNWKAAVALLNAMRLSTSTSNNDDNDEKWMLPFPNTFTYSLAIAACARCNQGKVALSLLNQMKETASSSKGGADDHLVGDSVWVYNAALLACSESSSSLAGPHAGRSKSNQKSNNNGTHIAMAFDIMEKMENDGSEGGAKNASPDTVSYNTVLSVLDESSFMAMKKSQSKETKHGNYSRLFIHDGISDVVMGILDSMEARGVSRDAITYYNAILACRSSPEDALTILRRSFSDEDFMQTISGHEIDRRQLKGRAASGVVFVVNSALSVAAKLGDVHVMTKVLSMLPSVDSKLNTESIKHIIRTLGQINDCDAILTMLICLKGKDFANDILKERYSIDILSNLSENSVPMIEEEVYSTAITSCLRHDELGMANQILLSMKKNGMAPNQRSLKEIIAQYCRMAMSTSKEEFKLARRAKRHREATSYGSGSPSRFGLVEPIYITSRARAKAALIMLKSVERPPPSLLSSVSKACCSAGLWQDARSILRRMHRVAIRELRQHGGGGDLATASVAVRVKGKFLDELPRLHRSLLKFCAKGGNITPALNFADDIQYLASQIRLHGKSLRGTAARKEGEDPGLITLSSRLLMDIPTPDTIPEADFSNADALSNILERPIGLTGQDWKLILIAASRGGHWKVALGTLPFIRPYVKETHPMYAREAFASSNSGHIGRSRPSLERLNKKYDRIARALTAAILCFEARSQYAWAIRAIDDWIEWSGRRPRKEAVASACRVLARRFRGQETLRLVTKVVNIPAIGETDGLNANPEVSDYTYEKAIYNEAIGALHNSGLYEEADQLYAAGVSNRHLPWCVTQGASGKKQLTLDLHGMSAAVAHSAVRVSLQKEIMGSSSQPSNREVMIIAGLDRRSGERFRSVLRPEMQRMLTREFYPPLGTSSVPGTMGALLVPGKDIEAWLTHQRQQKGERLLSVADVLRDISSGNRLERALLSSGDRLEQALRKKFESKNQGVSEGEDEDQKHEMSGENDN